MARELCLNRFCPAGFGHPLEPIRLNRYVASDSAIEPEQPVAKTRTETDTFGPIEVAADRYWGAQAQRSLGNFKIGWEKQPLSIVRALGIVKRAAAEANMELGRLDPKIGEAIVEAAQEVIDGKLDDAFPAGRLADRLGHAVEHERQRGDLEPRHRDARRRRWARRSRSIPTTTST